MSASAQMDTGVHACLATGQTPDILGQVSGNASRIAGHGSITVNGSQANAAAAATEPRAAPRRAPSVEPGATASRAEAGSEDFIEQGIQRQNQASHFALRRVQRHELEYGILAEGVALAGIDKGGVRITVCYFRL